MSKQKRKQYSIHFKSNIIKEVDEGLLNNNFIEQELCKIYHIFPYLLSKSLEK